MPLKIQILLMHLDSLHLCKITHIRAPSSTSLRPLRLLTRAFHEAQLVRILAGVELDACALQSAKDVVFLFGVAAVVAGEVGNVFVKIFTLDVKV